MPVKREWSGLLSSLGVALAILVPSCFGASGGPGGSGDGGCMSEALPTGARCAGRVVQGRLSFWSAPCGQEDEFPLVNHFHVCGLGCRNEGEVSWEYETMFLLCEEGSVRAPGFPCTFDIDCRSPVGASAASNLEFAAVGGLGGQGGGGGVGEPPGLGEPVDEALLVCESGVCQLGAPVAPVDVGESCTLATPSSAREGAAVGHAESCETGACLVAEPGQTQGVCSLGCSGTTACPAGFSCAEVTDGRYTSWELAEAEPLQLAVCVPTP